MNKEAIEKLLEKAKSVYAGYGSSERYKKLLSYFDQISAILKEQPPTSDFTKEARKYIDWSPCMSETTCKGYAERLRQACKIIDSDKASRKELVLTLLTGEITKQFEEWWDKLCVIGDAEVLEKSKSRYQTGFSGGWRAAIEKAKK